MRIIAKRTLKAFWEKHPDAEVPLKEWYFHVKVAKWTSPSDVTKSYPMARSLGSDRIVFKTKGNHYRLVVRIHFEHQIMLIRFIGTHRAYDGINAKEI